MNNQSITTLKGVGDSVAARLQKLGIAKIEDVIYNFPRKYQDFSNVTRIANISPGLVTLKVTISQAKGRYVRRGMHITEAVASDETDSVRIVWFNQPYRAESIKKDKEYYIAGEFGLHYGRLSIVNPHVELVSDFPVNAARIIPIYKETKGVTSKQVRKIVREVIPYMRDIPENLPDWVIKNNNLISYAEALESIHFPNNAKELERARHRLGLQEVFELMLASLLVKQEILSEPAQPVQFNEQLAKDFVKHLPFQLTDEQRRVVWQIFQDIQNTYPMNRLVEGDVGSGKTVVAAMAAVAVAAQGKQTVFMAPTELLARQHAQTLQELLTPLDMHSEIVLLVGSMTTQQKKRAHEAIADGKAKIIVGTHAVIQDKVDMHNLVLAIIDEQHRFGVEQRKKLMAKAGSMPHVLNLTATPIPRSLALTLYGELDISIISSKPKGRQKITTKICSPNSRKQLYTEIEKELDKGRQMFVVCPLITGEEDAQRSVEKVYKELTKIFKTRKIGLLHGKLKADEKNSIMQSFVDHDIDILVSTTVIEVGVDVPNASIMLLESADRFGLAQIHQLRGRVGRGEHAGYCYLMLSDSKAPSQRLRAIESSNDGFKLAELDLELRGPGAIYGTLQHGALDLRIANLADTKLLVAARTSAEQFIQKKENLLHYPQLHKRISTLQKVINLN